MNLKQLETASEQTKMTAAEKFHELNIQSRLEYENSLLKENLIEYEQLFRELKREQADTLLQLTEKENSMSESFENRLQELSGNVQRLKSSNDQLSSSINESMANVVTTLNDNIKKAYSDNIEHLEITVKQGINQLHTTADTKQKEIRDKSIECVNEIEAAIQKAKSRERRFFTFDSVKNVAFYVSCCLSVVETVLLVYFLFFKK